MRRALFPALTLALALRAGAALAAGCTISSEGPVAFGSYDVFSSEPLDSTGAISYSCTQTALPPVIRISAGRSGSFSSRTLANGTFTLGYNLFLDAGHSQIWGDGAGGTYAFTGAAPVDNQTYTVTIFGRISARQNVGAGSYSDTLTVTVDF